MDHLMDFEGGRRPPKLLLPITSSFENTSYRRNSCKNLSFLVDALDVEFGFSGVDFPPKGSKTQCIVVFHAKP